MSPRPVLQTISSVAQMPSLSRRFSSVSSMQTVLRRLADDIAAAVKRKDGDRASHFELVSRLNNPVLTKIIMELRDGMRLYSMDSAAGRQRQVASVKERYQLIDMASAGQTDAIAELITQHIRTWEPVFTASLTERLDRGLQSRGR